MDLEINKLLQSEIDQIKDIAWLLYDREGKGLTQEETYELIRLLLDFDKGFDVFIQEETNKVYEEGYDEGFNAARNMNDYDC